MKEFAIQAFREDLYEYGLEESHPASFHRNQRERLTCRVPKRQFRISSTDRNTYDSDEACESYLLNLSLIGFPGLCLREIGENEQLELNHCGETHFKKPVVMKAVGIDWKFRLQFILEEFFPIPDEVRQKALTLTIPTRLRAPGLRSPQIRSERAVLCMLKDLLPFFATIIIFLDRKSAAASIEAVSLNAY